MCGRYSLDASGPQIAARFTAADSTDGWDPKWNCRPTNNLPIIRQHPQNRKVESARWGWVRQFGPKAPTLLINAIGEEAAVKRTFTAAYRSRRCLVPATSYFEWVPKVNKTQPARPFAFARRDRGMVAIAGLWEEVMVDEHHELRFVLLTMAANAVVSPVHHRMPAVLDPADEALWLAEDTSPKRLEQVLQSLPGDALEAWEVSGAVSLTGKKAVEGPQLLLPI